MFNKLILEGNLTKDPEGKFLQSGTAVTTFRIASDYYDQRSKGKKAIYKKVQVWGKSAEACLEYLKKGSRVTVIGQLEDASWPDKNTGEIHVQEMINNAEVFFGARPHADQAPTLQDPESHLDEAPPEDNIEFPDEADLPGSTEPGGELSFD